jgi:hypothetical protein
VNVSLELTKEEHEKLMNRCQVEAETYTVEFFRLLKSAKRTHCGDP